MSHHRATLPGDDGVHARGGTLCVRQDGDGRRRHGDVCAAVRVGGSRGVSQQGVLVLHQGSRQDTHAVLDVSAGVLLLARMQEQRPRDPSRRMSHLGLVAGGGRRRVRCRLCTRHQAAGSHVGATHGREASAHEQGVDVASALVGQSTPLQGLLLAAIAVVHGRNRGHIVFLIDNINNDDDINQCDNVVSAVG